MMLRLATTLAVTALTVSCAPYADEPDAIAGTEDGRDCFFLSQVSGFTYEGRDTVHVSVGPSRTYEFKTLGSCPELGDSEVMGFDQSGPGTICRGIDVDLIVPTTIGPRRCAVSMIRWVEEDAQ